MNIHDEGVKLKAYLIALGRWEAVEWERVHEWIDVVLLHHAPVATTWQVAPAAPVEPVVVTPVSDPTPVDAEPAAEG